MINPIFMDISSQLLLVSIGNHIWQATLFGTLILGVMFLLKKSPARIRFYIGWIGLMKFALPSALFLLVFGRLDGIISSYDKIIGEAITPISIILTEPLFLFENSATASSTTAFSILTVLNVLGGIWVFIALFIFGYWQIRLIRLQRQLSRSSNPFPEFLTAKLIEIKNKIGYKGLVTGWLTESRIEPGVIGIFRPRIILANDLVDELTEEELKTILVHELIHIKHRDNFWSYLQMIIFCIFWFHPLVIWLYHRLTHECEKTCDEEVIKLTNDREAYTTGILKVSQFTLGIRMPGFTGITQSKLGYRIQSILNIKIQKDSKIMNRSIIIIVLILLSISMFTGGSLAKNGDINENEAIIEKLIVDQPYPSVNEEESIVIEKIKQLIDTNEYNQALEILEEAITDDSSPAFWLIKGSIHANAKEFENAAIGLENFIVEYPTYFEAQKSLGYVYATMKKFDKARQHLLRAIELGGEDARLYGLVGYSYTLDEEWVLAEMFFREAIKRDPAEPYWKDGLNSVIEKQNNVRSVSVKTSG